jgi:hypothetical protein
MSDRPYSPPDDPRLPKFTTYEEEAEFWDTHDAIDLNPLDRDELRKVDKERVEMPRQRSGLTRHLNVRLDDATFAEVQARARELGIGPSSLVRIWVRDRLRADRATVAPPES